MSNNKKVIVLGAGISGLTTAYLLHKDGYDVTVLEKNDNVGGSIETVIETDCSLTADRTVRWKQLH